MAAKSVFKGVNDHLRRATPLILCTIMVRILRAGRLKPAQHAFKVCPTSIHSLPAALAKSNESLCKYY